MNLDTQDRSAPRENHGLSLGIASKEVRSMIPHALYVVCILATLLLAVVPAEAGGGTAEARFDRVNIVMGARSGGAGSGPATVEFNAARLLADRLVSGSGVRTTLIREGHPGRSQDDSATLTILLGTPERHDEIAALFARLKIPPLTDLAPGPEGFLLKTVPGTGGRMLIAAGRDDRGCVYVAGEILRRVHFLNKAIGFPDDVDVRTAPAFELRGTQFGQSHIALQKAGVRKWTQAEVESKIADFALAGANVLQVPANSTEDDPTYRYIKSLGLKTIVHWSANAGSGPPEWQAKESIGRTGYLCPSVPEARQELLRAVEAAFSKSPHFDYISFSGGDGGGCECDRCKPYGAVFIRLVEDYATIIHKYHPDAQVMFTNQKFDNEDDLAIFRYLRETPNTGIRAFCVGPGSDAMSWQPGHRQHHRMDLFRYPRFGPFSRYMQEIVHQLPPHVDLAFYNEITHWRYAQHAYIQAYPRPDKDGNHPPHWNHFIYERMPDPYLTQVYDRLTFFAWPRFYRWVFGEVVRYGLGDCTHSSGTHDHFNQWMWQRLLWSPHRTVEDVVDEYCRTWFGPEAAPYMAKAIFLMEEYLQWDPQRPITQKTSIDRYYDLVMKAGKVMPPRLMKSNWLWREFAQKAAIDKRTKLAVARQMAIQRSIERDIAHALSVSGPSALNAVIERCLRRLPSPPAPGGRGQGGGGLETPAMRRLREEAIRLGEESNALYGVRSEGLASLDHDFIGLGWLKRQLLRAREATGQEKLELLQTIADYENPGPGGFYDNLGTYENAPHLVKGYPYDYGQPYVGDMLDEGNRLSQRTMGYTQDEAEGLTLRYEGLDPSARYRIRFTLVRPWFQPRYAYRMNQKAQSIYADGIPLAEGLEVPEKMSDFFTFDIPPEATSDGVLTISFRKMPDVAAGDRVSVEQWRNCGGWGTLCSEVWLMKAK
jgi:hypothetical protein